LIMLFNLSKSRRTQEDKRSQKLALSKWVKKVQAFLELMNYYWKFVPNYAKIAEPLTQLMHKNKRWHWDKEQKNAFHTLKKSLSRTAHLRILNSTCKRYWKPTHQISQ
jgi:hypothetical protein